MDRSLDDRAADRIGTIEHPELFPKLPRTLHRVRHRRDVRVRPRADVLNVEEQHVDSSQHLGARMTRRAVEAEYGEARLRINRRGNRGAGAAIAAEAMFRRIDRLEANVAVVADRVDDRFEPRCDAARVGDDADAATVQGAPIRAEEDLVAEFDPSGRHRLGAGACGRRKSEAGASG